MGAMSRELAVDDVDPEYDWAEPPRAEFSVQLPRTTKSVWDGRTPGRAERLRSVAVTVWFAWLIAAGVVVGGTLLVVLARLAAVVLRWAVAA